MKKYLVLSLVLLVSIAFASRYENPYERKALIKRIEPVGQVAVAGQADVTETAASAPAAPKKPLTGAEVYNQYCTVCHAAGVAGAPKFKDAASWAPRKKQGMDTLLKHAIGGLNAMPPKGTCMNCSDKEIEAAIKYMLP